MKVELALNSIPNNTMSKDVVVGVKSHPPNSGNNANIETPTSDNMIVDEVMTIMEIHREGESSVFRKS